MKNNIKLIIILCLAASFFSACKKDNTETPSTLDGKLEYDGKVYPLQNGLIEDYGAILNHYNLDVYMVNRSFTSHEKNGPKVLVYFELFASGTEAFKTGTFTYTKDSVHISNPDLKNKNFFSIAEIGLDHNLNGTIEESEFFKVTDGTATVSDSDLGYSLTFDVILSNGKVAKGVYSKTFQYEEERRDESSTFEQSAKQVKVKQISF